MPADLAPLASDAIDDPCRTFGTIDRMRTRS